MRAALAPFEDDEGPDAGAASADARTRADADSDHDPIA
jgi:hypothetical protein